MVEKLDRILADVKTRLGTLETQSANTTRSILDQIIREVVETRDRLIEEIATLRDEFNVITPNLISLRDRGDRALIKRSRGCDLKAHGLPSAHENIRS